MIAGIRGTLEGRGPGWALSAVGGMVLRVHMSTSTLSELGSVGQQVSLRTHLYFREDVIALYGFASDEELGLFQSLTGVSGVGPRVALSLLSALPPQQLSLAIATGNVDMLTHAPGVGKKLAGRVVLELKGKLEAALAFSPLAATAEADVQVIAALTALGYSLSEASRAAAALPAADLPLEEKVRLALQGLGRG